MIDWDALVIGPLLEVFGEAVQPTYTPVKAGGAPYAIDGVFDRAYLSVAQLDAVSAASTVKPVLGVRESEFSAPPQVDDLVYVPSVNLTYIVRNVESDGHGWAKLELNMVKSGQ